MGYRRPSHMYIDDGNTETVMDAYNKGYPISMIAERLSRTDPMIPKCRCREVCELIIVEHIKKGRK